MITSKELAVLFQKKHHHFLRDIKAYIVHSHGYEEPHKNYKEFANLQVPNGITLAGTGSKVKKVTFTEEAADEFILSGFGRKMKAHNKKSSGHGRSDGIQNVVPVSLVNKISLFSRFKKFGERTDELLDCAFIVSGSDIKKQALLAQIEIQERILDQLYKEYRLC